VIDIEIKRGILSDAVYARAVAERVAAIVVGNRDIYNISLTPNEIFFGLGTGNNWRLRAHLDWTPQVVTLSYRYELTEEQWAALKTVIEWALR